MIREWLTSLLRHAPLADGTYRFPRSVPFVTQRLPAETRAKEGFDDPVTAAHWERRICGIACLKMALLAFDRQPAPTLRELLDDGRAHGAYREDVGWVHRGLAVMAERHGLRARSATIGDDLGRIVAHLGQGGLVIASVSVGLEAEAGRGGHLVLIRGVTVAEGAVTSLLLHHPSSDAAYERADWEVPAERFRAAFSRRGNVIFLS
jgi:hypothetical protein